mgnify:FL=1
MLIGDVPLSGRTFFSNGKSNELFFDLKHSVDSNYLAFVQQSM